MASCTRCFSELSELAVFCPACGQPHAPAFDKLLGRTLDSRYVIEQRLTNGGLSAVFLAADLQTQKPVVIKLSDPQHLTRRELTYALDTSTARSYWAEMLERMHHEAEMLLSLRHPNIVKLHDTALLHTDLRYLVFEYLQGATLSKTLLRQQRLPLAEALRITLAIADALEHVHARGIVHRDVNPNNVMLCVVLENERGRERETERLATPNGPVGRNLSVSPSSPLSVSATSLVKLIDFGIAKFPQPPGAPPFTQHSMLRGTVAYAAPEQCQNQPLDARSDIYSLGVMLYEMTTGQRPFAGRTPTEIALQQIQATPLAPRQINPELFPDLEAVILRALAKNPADRPASAAAFASELRNAARRIVIDLPAPAAVPLIVSSPAQDADAPKAIAATEPFQFTSFERAARPRRILPRALVACAILAVMLSAAVGTLDTQRIARLFNGSELPPLEALTTASVTSPASSANESNATTTQNPASTAEPSATNSPDAFEMTTQPIRTLAASLATHMTWSGLRKTPVATTKQGRELAPMLAQISPMVVAGEAALPPYAVIPPPAHPANAAIPDYAQAPTPRVEPINYPATNTQAATTWPTNRNRTEPVDESEYSDARVTSEENKSWEPHLISWNGPVDGERLLRIELPGKPGRVEIPPAFRRRVGIVEPPQPGNDWRCVRLRVMGKGVVNLVIRWWPK